MCSSDLAHTRRFEICAVAGMRMPPLDRRSPSRSGMRTSTRSLSILIGNFWSSKATPAGYRLRSMNVRALPRVVAPTLALVALSVVAPACIATDSSSRTTAAPDSTAPGPTFAPTTSFMPDCGAMPSGTEISALVGVPVDDGIVTGAGLCQFTGVNDPSAVVLLQWLTDPGDRQSFLDLQVSLGEPERIRTSGLTDGRIGPDGTVWVDRDGTVYTVLVSVTGEPASDQSDRATDVLAAWLKG